MRSIDYAAIVFMVVGTVAAFAFAYLSIWTHKKIQNSQEVGDKT